MASAADHEVRLVVVEGRVERIEPEVAELNQRARESELVEREMKTNWRLVMAIGGLAGTALVAIIVRTIVGG